jgi:hypothetical protein
LIDDAILPPEIWLHVSSSSIGGAILPKISAPVINQLRYCNPFHEN